MSGGVGALVSDYVAMRRGLGYRSRVQERALRAFARHLDRAGHRGPIPLETSLDWASATASPDPCNPARRLGMVRGFLRHLSAIDGETEVPAPGLLGPAGHRTPPHVYSDREIAELLQAATGLAPAGGLRPHCYAVLLGLIACTGLRIGEALALTCGDVDLAQGVLTVRAGKRGRTRVVPLHPSALDPLARLRPGPGPALRPAAHGCGVLPHRPQRPDRLQRRQPRLSAAAPPAGLDRGRAHPRATRARPAPPHGGPPHPVLARPRVSTSTAKIPLLATYLGHVEVRELYWYLSAVPELMSIVAQRFEHFAGHDPAGAP